MNLVVAIAQIIFLIVIICILLDILFILIIFLSRRIVKRTKNDRDLYLYSNLRYKVLLGEDEWTRNVNDERYERLVE